MLLTLLLLVVLIIVLYLYSIWTYDFWEKRGVPFLKPLPLFGNTLDVVALRKTQAELWAEVHRIAKGLPLIGIYHFRIPSLLIRDPELIKTVLVTNFECFNGTPMKVDRRLDPLLSRITFVLTGNVWRAVRSLLVPAFTAYRVKSQFPLMAMGGREMVQFLEKEAPKCRSGGLNVRQMVRKFAIDVVVRCGFGIIGNSFSESEAVVGKLGELMATVGKWKGIRLTIFTLIPKMPNFLRARFMDVGGQEFFRKLIRQLIQYREQNQVFRNDYLQMLMHIKCMGKSVKGRNTIRVADVDMEFTDEDVVSHALMLFFLGSEITSFVLTNVLFELARNASVQARLRGEIDTVLWRYNGGLTYEAVEEMIYLDMVLNETLRKHPPFPLLPRECTRACELPRPAGGTFVVEEGTAVIISTQALHMDPEHFPDPEKFDPERFSEERKASIKPYTFLPFGDGPRHCFAFRFAKADVKAGLVALVSHFEIRTTPRTPVKLVRETFGFAADVKGGVWLDFVRRK